MHWAAMNTILASALLAGQIGAIRAVTVDSNDNGTVSFRVSGANPCGAVHFEYGDGQVQTHPLVELPATVTHRYPRSGDFAVRVRGMGNCEGQTALNVRTFVSVPTPVPTQPSALPPQSQGRGLARGRDRSAETEADLRFPGMDRNDDGVISQAEWQGSVESFRVHDWNRDGVLSGTELRRGEGRPDLENPEDGRGGVVPNWSRPVFQRLDRDGNGRLTFDEWAYESEAFRRADVNGDRVLTSNEFLSTEVDDDRDDRFDYLDLNNDGFVSQAEWHGSPLAFGRIDRNGDRRLSRYEMLGDDISGTAGQPTRVSVDATRSWVDSGIVVRAGEELVVTSRGEVQLSDRPGDRADADGSIIGRVSARSPIPRSLVGTLIARIGRSAPFAVTTGGQRVRMPQGGRLYFGVNDADSVDNQGAFDVIVRRIR
jgi:hypothetical protein